MMSTTTYKKKNTSCRALLKFWVRRRTGVLGIGFGRGGVRSLGSRHRLGRLIIAVPLPST